MAPMNPLARLMAWIRPKPKSPEEIAAQQEAERLRADLTTTRSAAPKHPGSGAGQNYESQGRRR
jgi:hypothetical protein